MGGADEDEGGWGLVRAVLRVVAACTAVVWLVLAGNSLVHGRIVNGLLQLCISAAPALWAWGARKVVPTAPSSDPVRVTASPRLAARASVVLGVAVLLIYVIPLFDRHGGAASPTQRTVNFVYVGLVLLAVRSQRLFRGQELTVTTSLVSLRAPRLVRPGHTTRVRKTDNIDGIRARWGSIDLLPRARKDDPWRTRLPGIATYTLPAAQVIEALRSVGVSVE